MQPFTLSITALIIAMTSIQLGASFAKQLFPVVGPIGATTLRLCFATLMLFAIWRPWRGKLSSRELLAISLYGASLGCMNLLFYLSLARIPLGIAVALEFTGPLAVALLASRRTLDFVWAILAIIGILLILPISKASAALDPWGMLLALGAGVCWAFYIIFGQKVSATIHSGRATALGMLVATLVVLPASFVYTGSEILSLKILPFALMVAVLSSALPYSLEMMALKNVPVKTFGILMSLEPALGALSGLLLLQEYLSFAQWGAIACIIAASAGSSLYNYK